MTRFTIMNVLFIIVLILAGLLFLLQVANLLSMQTSDPFGRGMSQAFGVFLSIGLWVLLAGLFAMAWTKGDFPSFSGLAVLVLLPASLSAMLATNHLFKSVLGPRWLVIPAAMPPMLLAFFAIALWVPALRSGVQSFEMNCAVWGTVLLLSAVPWIFVVNQSRENASYAAELDLQRQTQDQTRHERFAQLNSNSTLAEWLEFAEWGSDRRDEALAGIRQLPEVLCRAGREPEFTRARRASPRALHPSTHVVSSSPRRYHRSAGQSGGLCPSSSGVGGADGPFE
jgi:hypothetical protein